MSLSFSAPDHFGARVVGDRTRLLNRGLRLTHGDGIVPRVDQHKKIALVDELVVGDRQTDNLARHLRAIFTTYARTVPSRVHGVPM